MKKAYLFIFLLLRSNILLADSANACELVYFSEHDGAKVLLTQKVFDGGFQELAIVHQEANAQEKVTRLSFAGSKENGCHFPAFSSLKGGEWGWHVVWTSSANQGVFYARVDGDAWVSSLPKRLSRDLAEKVTISETQGQLIITMRYSSNLDLHEQQFFSEDEGRSWKKLAP